MSTESLVETIGGYVKHLLPRISDLPTWPPDVFCLAAHLLHKSGTYTTVVDNDRPRVKLPNNVEWPRHVQEVGKEWGRNFAKLPVALQPVWSLVRKDWKLSLCKVRYGIRSTAALFHLLACADGAGAFTGRGSLLAVQTAQASAQQSSESALRAPPPCRCLSLVQRWTESPMTLASYLRCSKLVPCFQSQLDARPLSSGIGDISRLWQLYALN